jgi:hypothetical protein
VPLQLVDAAHVGKHVPAAAAAACSKQSKPQVVLQNGPGSNTIAASVRA